MFDSLSDRLQGVFRSLRGEARFTDRGVPKSHSFDATPPGKQQMSLFD